MSPEEKTIPVLKKQVIMRKVLLALLPCVAGSVYFFGWRSLAVVAVSWLAGFLTEYVFCRSRKEPVSEAVFVTATIFPLILPPTVPWHVLVIGVVFAVAFSKEVFGGFGRNVFNPAMVGRCFIYICFPVAMTAAWAPAAQGPWGALGIWSTASLPDAITSATPMALATKGLADFPTLTDLFFGRISGTMGVTSALLILVGGLYLYVTKTANRSIILTVIIVYAVINELLHRLGVNYFPGALQALMGAGFLFGAFFMATDPVSAPNTPEAKIIYAALIAVFTAVISNYSVFNGGFMFALLLANMFAPILDVAVKEFKKKKKAPDDAGKVAP